MSLVRVESRMHSILFLFYFLNSLYFVLVEISSLPDGQTDKKYANLLLQYDRVKLSDVRFFLYLLVPIECELPEFIEGSINFSCSFLHCLSTQYCTHIKQSAVYITYICFLRRKAAAHTNHISFQSSTLLLLPYLYYYSIIRLFDSIRFDSTLSVLVRTTKLCTL